MRKAVHSIHSNIAEGDGRLSRGEWIQFLGQARGSVIELESDVIAAFDLHYCDKAQTEEVGLKIRRVAQLVNGTLRSATGRRFEKKKFG
jgi:four helix bundle protein